eukprot:TRINITY_DN1089_c0_g1_i3.p1 TRINITY_DN1089_c0_g1~~TRINITY_DN1089_c0_g1_i3.p1  ORF type:complete len:132 (+),score=27.86 TRINITY_DN1089_c0_g1_i3:190-585(+)
MAPRGTPTCCSDVTLSGDVPCLPGMAELTPRLASRAMVTIQTPRCCRTMRLIMIFPNLVSRCLQRRRWWASRACWCVRHGYCALNPAADPVLCVDTCLLYTSDAADDLLCVDLGGRRIIKKKKKNKNINKK